jgi:transcriptional regulator with XRE-family HTH domain
MTGQHWSAMAVAPDRRWMRQEIATRLRRARFAAGLSQQQLADRLGVARSQLSMWENARRPLYAEDLLLLAHRLAVTPGTLLPEP